ncbi:hypothetical protein CHS0354_014908 [Potamilus streckersoni]|uniref:Ig-like domain-containing protein n=1 Tax=Potamilus streckersoni TaxID=2493646 RepID=A0AAE0SRY1_9BIVA|nr:hypothetical protein CHS0354_014908 [Potamilus streckersoni]
MWIQNFGINDKGYGLLKFVLLFDIMLLYSFRVISGDMEYRHPVFSTDTPDNVTHYKGERATLQCSIRYLGTKEVIWKKQNEPHVLTVGKFVFVDDPSYAIDHVSHRQEWNLIIVKVKPRHAGVYECQVSTKEDLRRLIQLNVIDKPAPKKDGIAISGKEFVDKGDPIIITCNATGENRPPDDIDWFKDGTKLKPDAVRNIYIEKYSLVHTKTLHSTLEIENSDMSDSGNYVCRSSDLLITSKNIMVLNAETKPGKRGGFQSGTGSSADSSQTRPSSTAVPQLQISVDAYYCNLFLTFIIVYVISNLIH